jgi:hypothetical protein
MGKIYYEWNVSSDLEYVVDSAESKENIMVDVNVFELNKTEDNL